MRPILELAGVRDVLSKSIGSANPVNCAWATIRCLKSLKRADEVARLRGKTVAEMVPWLIRLREEEAPPMAVEEELEEPLEDAE